MERRRRRDEILINLDSRARVSRFFPSRSSTKGRDHARSIDVTAVFDGIRSDVNERGISQPRVYTLPPLDGPLTIPDLIIRIGSPMLF